jgi:Phage tail lysozyme
MIVHAAIEGAAAHGDWGAAQNLFDKYSSVLAPNVSAAIGQELHAKARKAGNDAYLDNLMGGQIGDSGLNGAPRPNTASHVSGDLVVANQPSGQPIEQPAVERATAIIDGLKQRGIDPVTAAAFAANSLHESGANPNVGAGDKGASHGLFQWRDDRAGALQKFTGQLDGAPLDKQLDFLVKELHGDEAGAFAAINSAQGLAAKAAAVSKYFERPNDINGEQARRSATALQLASQIGMNVPGASQATAPAQGGPAPAQPSPSPAAAPVQSSPGEVPQTQPSAATPAQPAKAPADQYPDESALTLQILRDTRADPEQREALLSGMRQRMSIINMVTEKDRYALGKAIPNIEAALTDGKDGVQIPEAQIRHLLPPAKADEIMEDMNVAQAAGQSFKSVAWGSPEDVEAARQRLTAGLGPASTMVKKGGIGGVADQTTTEDTNTDAYRMKQRVLAKFDEKVAARNAAITADPAAFASNSPVVVQAAAKLDENNPQSVQDYFSAITAVQNHLGVPQSMQHILTERKAQNIAATLGGADPTTTDVGKMLDKMSATYGDYWGQAFGDVVKLGKLSPQYQTLAMIGDKSVRNDFQRMLATAQEKGGTSKLKDAASEQARTDINQNIDTALSDFSKSFNVPGISSNPDIVASMKDSIRNLALFYTLQGSDDGAAALKRATAGVLGRYDFEGYKRIPKGTGALVDAATDNVIANLKPEDLAPPGGGYDTRQAVAATPESFEASKEGQAATLKQAQEDTLAMVKNKPTWVTNESDNGLVLYTQKRDGLMVAVRHPDGSRVEVPFANLSKLAQPPVQQGTVGGVAPSDMTILGASF